MKVAFLLIFAFFFLSLNAQTDNPNYDKALADSLNADEYGMKSYVFVILTTGSDTAANKEERNTIFRGHFDNISSMAEKGKLIVAGPLEKNEQSYRGIFILDVHSIEEGKELLKNDPAINRNILRAEYFTLYASAALPTYLENHEKVEKRKP